MLLTRCSLLVWHLAVFHNVYAFVESTSSAKQTYMRLKRTQNEDNDCDVNKYCGCFTVNLFSHFFFFFLCFLCGFFSCCSFIHIFRDSVFTNRKFRWFACEFVFRIRSHLICIYVDFLSSLTPLLYSLNTQESATISRFFLSLSPFVCLFFRLFLWIACLYVG